MSKVIKVQVIHDGEVSEHGTGIHQDEKFFQFIPDESELDTMTSFRARGIGQRMTDGSFHFVPSPSKKTKSVVLVKVPHGKLSITADDCYQLTLKIGRDENNYPLKTLLREAVDALK